MQVALETSGKQFHIQKRSKDLSACAEYHKVTKCEKDTKILGFDGFDGLHIFGLNFKAGNFNFGEVYPETHPQNIILRQTSRFRNVNKKTQPDMIRLISHQKRKASIALMVSS